MITELRRTYDGTYELLTSLGGATEILPHAFTSEDDAKAWMSSLKGRRMLAQARARLWLQTRRASVTNGVWDAEEAHIPLAARL